MAIITPWNFPLAIPAWKIAPALVCGNTIVYKPASATPLSAVKLVEIFEEAGLPAGVLNLVTGPGASVGNTLVEDERVGGISFTGSTEIGTSITARGSELLKKVQCEMGGKNAAIILNDADLDKAVPGVVQGAFGSTGQRCTATSRAIVEDGIYNEFMDALLAQTEALTVGDGMDSSKDVAPLASRNQLDTVLEYIGIGTEEGARLTFGGHQLRGDEFDEVTMSSRRYLPMWQRVCASPKKRFSGPCLACSGHLTCRAPFAFPTMSTSVFRRRSTHETWSRPTNTSTPPKLEWSTSTPQLWVERCTFPSVVLGLPAQASANRALKDSTSSPKPSASTSTTRQAQRKDPDLFRRSPEFPTSPL